MSRSQALLVASVLLIAAGCFDYVLDWAGHFDFVFTAIYMVPIGFIAWVCGFSSGILTSALAVAIEGWVSYHGLSTRHGDSGNAVIIIMVMEMLSFTAGSFVIARLRDALEYERTLSRSDHLTGLSNLRAFWEDLETEVERMNRDRKPLTVVYMDVDDFKQVNDALGHDGGDEVLRTLAHTLRDSTRAIDTSARVGGDEFALVLPNADESAASIVVERLRAKFATLLKKKNLTATLSIGIAVFHEPPKKLDQTVRAADATMYEAKGMGKDHVVCRAY